jgi:hypothetical protein
MRNCRAKKLLASYDRKRRGFPGKLADSGESPVACRNVGRDFGVNTKLCGTPEWIRTTDLLLRRQTLYPAELRAHNSSISIVVTFERPVKR